MTISTTKHDLIKSLFEHKVIEINLDKPFVLASGITSPLYLDHRRIFSVPSLRQNLVNAWRDFLTEAVGKNHVRDVVFAGTATAGIAPAYALADAFQASFVYVRSKLKEHGTGRAIEGIFEPEKPHIVVDDMVTTGGSLLRAVDILINHEVKVLCASSVTSHNFSIMHDNFKARHIKLHCYFTTAEIFDSAYQHGLMNSAQMRAVGEWIARSEDKNI